MADLDIWPRGIPRGWRRVMKLIGDEAVVGSGASREREDATASAVASSLRETGGCPQLPQLVAALPRLLTEAPSDWQREADLIARRHPHPNVGLALEAVVALREQYRTGGAPTDFRDVGSQLAEDFVKHFARRYESRAELRAGLESDSQDSALRAEDAARLGTQLLAHADGINIRAPARRTPRADTAELIERPLDRQGGS